MEYQLEYLAKLHPNQSGILSSANRIYQHRSWTGFLMGSISFVEETAVDCARYRPMWIGSASSTPKQAMQKMSLGLN